MSVKQFLFYTLPPIVLIGVILFFTYTVFNAISLFKSTSPIHDLTGADVGWGNITAMEITDNARTGSIAVNDQLTLSVTYHNLRKDVISVNSMVHVESAGQPFFKTEDLPKTSGSFIAPIGTFTIRPGDSHTEEYPIMAGKEGDNQIKLMVSSNETNAPASTYTEVTKDFDSLSIQDIILKESDKNNQDSANIAASIAGVTAVALISQGIILLKTRNDQKLQGQANLLSNIFTKLNTDEHRLARRQVYTVYDDYKSKKDLTKYDVRPFYDAVNMIRADFDEIGLLVTNKIIPIDMFMKIHVDTVILCWKALAPHIVEQRKLREFPEYMINFEKLFEEAEKYWNKMFPDRKLPEPSIYDRIH